MYPLIETIRFENGIFQNIDLHQERFSRSRLELNSSFKPLQLENFLKIPSFIETDIVYKVRVQYGENIGPIDWDIYTQKEISSFFLIEIPMLDYHLKFVDRTNLNPKTPPHCTPIITKNGFITDTTYGNLLFKKEGNWFTPSTPLLHGVMRESLLRSLKISVKEISVKDLILYEAVKMINAMIPFERAQELPIRSIK